MIVFRGVRRTVAVAGAALALIGAGGCAKLATDDSVEEQIRSQLGTDTADCPADLQGEVGRSIVCQATSADRRFDVKVTVTSVEGDRINFKIERVGAAPTTAAPTAPTAPASEVSPASPQAPADPAAQVVDGKKVAQSVFDQLTATVGQQPDEVSCPDLPAKVGASVRCRLKTGTDVYGVTVKVSTVEGTDVRFDIQVDQQPTR
jgi:hypothetical protein